MYLVIKFLHVCAVIAFVGNIVTGLFWHAHAARTRDPRLLEFAMSGIIRSDRIFTIPGVLGIIATGVSAAMLADLPVLGTKWILWTIVMFAISGAIFMIRIAPLQRALHAFADKGAQSPPFDYAGYHRLAVRWELWGLAAVLTPIAGIALMVLKPSL